jgi:hypothetical protein
LVPRRRRDFPGLTKAGRSGRVAIERGLQEIGPGIRRLRHARHRRQPDHRGKRDAGEVRRASPARQNDLHALKRTVPAVRVTSEAAKANHHQGTAPARGPSRATAAPRPARAAALAPMVNGVRTDMVNDRLIVRARLPSFRGAAQRRARTTLCDHTQPLSSRMASCQIISMPASLSLRHGIAAKFCPP